MVKPVTPDEAYNFKEIPDDVIATFNRLIARNFSGKRSFVLQEDVVAELVRLGYDRKDIFRRHLLDVEGLYSACGWDVKYDRPAYNEDYSAAFEFVKRG